MSAVDKVLATLERVKPSGRGQWMARCPAHDDRTPSLSIKEADNGGVLLHCFAGCEVHSVLGAIGLEMGDLYPPNLRSESRGNAPDPFRPKWQRPHAERAKPAAPAVDDEPERKVVQFTRADQIVVRPTQWLLDGWLVRDTLAGLVAPSGACKSFLAIDWACRIATGTPWFGREVEQGAVFYLAGEGISGLRKRVAAWEKASGVSINGAPLFIADGLPGLCEDGITEEVADEIERVADQVFFDSGCHPQMIVIDTLARAMSGRNENSSEDMGAFVAAKDRLRKRWGATVLSIHHTGLAEEAQERGRGSGAYRAALDSEFVIKPGNPSFTVRSTKCKDWAAPHPLNLQRVVVEVELTQADGTKITDSSLALHDVAGAIKETGNREKAVHLRSTGKTEREISDLLGVPKTTVHRWLKAEKPVQKAA